MSDMAIRPARSSDAPQIGAVGYAAWLKGIGVHVGPEAHRRIGPETYESFARSSAEHIIVAEIDGAAAGFAASESGDDCISDLWVAPDFEGRGLGSALLAAAERAVAGRDYAAIEIEVLTANGRALGLYRRLGYETVWQGTRQDPFLGVDLHKTRLRKPIGKETWASVKRPASAGAGVPLDRFEPFALSRGFRDEIWT